MRSRIRIVLTVAVAVVLLACGTYVIQRNSSLSAAFQAIAPGMSKEQVIVAMGKPTAESSGCRDAATWLDQPVIGKTCATELRYDASLTPKFWTIGFDAKGMAIAKYEYVSP